MLSDFTLVYSPCISLRGKISWNDIMEEFRVSLLFPSVSVRSMKSLGGLLAGGWTATLEARDGVDFYGTGERCGTLNRRETVGFVFVCGSIASLFALNCLVLLLRLSFLFPLFSSIPVLMWFFDRLFPFPFSCLLKLASKLIFSPYVLAILNESSM